MLSLLAWVAQLETEMRAERVSLGIAAAKARGAYKGNGRTKNKKLHAQLDYFTNVKKQSIKETAESCGCCINTVKKFRAVQKEAENEL